MGKCKILHALEATGAAEGIATRPWPARRVNSNGLSRTNNLLQDL